MGEEDGVLRLHELAAIVESSRDAIIGKRLDGTITSWNNAAEQMYGYSADEVIGRSIELLEPDDRRGEIAGFHERLRAGERLADIETVRRCKDGSLIHVELSISPIMDRGKTVGAATIARDLTEKQRLEAELRQTQKMDAIGRLAGGIAHDFNNLLVVIRGNCHLLLGSLEGEEREIAAQIDAAAERASDLTRSLLAFSRQRVLRLQVLDLNAIIEDTVGFLRRSLEENIEIKVDLAAGLDSVLGDRSELANAILNLAINARDAMPDGGTLQIRTAAVDVSTGERRAELPPGRYVFLQMTDSGVGMDEEIRSQAFDPFFTTKRDGTGLGLAAVYGVVNQSGGHVWFYSEPGHGTTFKLYFPVSAETATAPEPAPETPTVGGTETILVVEDTDMVRDLVVATLESYGYQVHAVANAEEALEFCENGLGEVDLLLTDVIMPGMNGRELAERLLAVRPSLKVLFTSGYPADTVLRLGIAESVADFIEKPYLPDQLAGTIRSILDRDGP